MDRHRLHRAWGFPGVSNLSGRASAVAAAVLAVAVAVPFLLTGLGAVPFDDPGEGMHAQIAREMLAGGRVLPLTLGGVPYVDKPPLLYALMAAAFSVAGPSEGAARLVSALAALVAVGFTAWLGARLGDARTGLVAGLALLASIGFFVYGRYVRPVKFGLGGVPFGNEFEVVSDEDAYKTLEAAWNAGVRYYDVSPWYGLGLGERRYGNFRDSYVLCS